ncbi:hypothetical protein V2J09_000476, partial [Rumex salicifolius]
TLLKIASIRLLDDLEATDTLCWSGSTTGEYSISSAYEIIRKHQPPLPDGMRKAFELIWKLKTENNRTNSILPLVGCQGSFDDQCGKVPTTLLATTWAAMSARRSKPYGGSSSQKQNIGNSSRLHHLISCSVTFKARMGDNTLFTALAWWSWKDRYTLIFKLAERKKLRSHFILRLAKHH